MIMEHNVSARHCIESPEKLPEWNRGHTGIRRVFWFENEAIKGFVVLVGLDIGPLYMLRIDFIELLFVPKANIGLLVWLWDHIHIWLNEVVMIILQICHFFYVFLCFAYIRFSLVDQDLLGEQEMLIKSILLYLLLLRRKDELADFFRMWYDLVGKLQILILGILRQASSQEIWDKAKVRPHPHYFIIFAYL